MDKEARGRLLADQEELQGQIADLRRRINGASAILSNIADKLRNSPDHIIFSGAPSPFEEIPPELLNARGHAIDWNSIPPKELYGQYIQDLRKLQNKLLAVQMQLTAKF